MAATLDVNVFGDKLTCREFFDVIGTSTEVSGIEILRGKKRIGSMISVSLPDPDDSEEYEKFINQLEVWLVEND